MTIKKSFVLVGSLLILGMGLISAAEKPQTKALNMAKERAEMRQQVGTLFVDENGDGICDYARDYDKDGIPNRQDPDWARPKDGTGYKNRQGKNSSPNQFGNRKGFQGGNSWNKQSFRNNQGPFGRGICDDVGPKGKSRKGGRG